MEQMGHDRVDVKSEKKQDGRVGVKNRKES